MSEYKFICPSCGQKVVADAAASGQQIDCPSCQTSMLAPAVPENPEQIPAAEPALGETPPLETPSDGIPTPPKSEPEEAAPQEREPVKTMAKQAPSKPSATKPAPSKGNRIAALTPEIKREIVRSVRRRVADESHWMPRYTSEGDYAYAAKEVDGKQELVKPTDPDATRFSLLGAILLEYDQRQVIRTAQGRSEFIDKELVEAIRAVAEEGGTARPKGKKKDAPAITHAQSMKTLDVLEDRFTRELEESARGDSGSIEDLRLVDLDKRLAKKSTVSTEQLISAVKNELEELNRRVKALEKKPAKDA